MIFCQHQDENFTFLNVGIFKDIGIIEDDTIIEVQRSDLIAEHIGGTNAKVEKVLKRAEGRVLFVDEAYTLSSTTGKDYGKEAIEAMMARMTAHPDKSTKNPIFIFAGYEKEMNNFLDVNPGLQRRLPNKFKFDDYSPKELAEISNKLLLQSGMDFPHGVIETFTNCFSALSGEVRKKWNGGLCELLLEYILNEQVKRLDFESSVQEINRLTKEDIENGIQLFLSEKKCGQEENKELGTMTEIIVRCDKWTQTPEVVMNVPGIGLVFSSP